MHSSELFDENLTGKSGLLDQTTSFAGVGILMGHTPSEPYGGWDRLRTKCFQWVLILWWIMHFRASRTQHRNDTLQVQKYNFNYFLVLLVFWMLCVLWVSGKVGSLQSWCYQLNDTWKELWDLCSVHCTSMSPASFYLILMDHELGALSTHMHNVIES